LGINDWTEFTIVLRNDKFICLHPSEFDAQTFDKTTDHHEKHGRAAPWRMIESIRDQLPSIFEFASNWLPSTEGEVYIYLTTALDIAFYHPSGVLLTVQFEVGTPEGRIDRSWGSTWGPVVKK